MSFTDQIADCKKAVIHEHEDTVWELIPYDHQDSSLPPWFHMLQTDAYRSDPIYECIGLREIEERWGEDVAKRMLKFWWDSSKLETPTDLKL